MAMRFGQTDDIMPWTRDTFGALAEPPDVAPTQSMEAAAQPGVDPAAATATIGDIPAGALPAMTPAAVGGGLERTQTPTALAAAKRQETIDKTIGTWEENPGRRLAFVLQAGLAGFVGQKPAYLGAIERAERQEQVELQKALTGIQVIEHAQKTAAKLPEDKRKEFIASTKKQFAVLGPAFGEQLDTALSGKGATLEQLNALTDDPKWYMTVAGGDLSKALELAQSPEIRKIASDRADMKNAKTIGPKLLDLQEKAMALAGQEPGFQKLIASFPKGPQGQTYIPIGMLDQFNDLLPAQLRLSGSELNTLKRNDEIAFASGVMPAKMEMKIAENALTSQPEIVKLQNAYNAAINSGDGATAALIKRKIQKELRDDPKSPITLTGPDGELRTLPQDSGEAQRLMRDGWVQASEWNSAQKLYVDTNNVGYMATPLQVRELQRQGIILQPAERGQTVTTDVNGVKTTISQGNLNLSGMGILPRIGASSAPGPVMLGPLSPAAPAGDAGAAAAPGGPSGESDGTGGATPKPGQRT
ncbi:MAG: hypothetical protein WA210_24015, partial [Burkholderiaceae bacterium]